MQKILRFTGAAIVALSAVLSFSGVRAESIAPGAGASGTALQVRPADTVVGGAEASATPSGGDAGATSAQVLGREVVSQPVEIAPGDARLRVAPRSSSVTSYGDGRRESHAYAALLDGGVPGLVRLEVLSGRADAVWAGTSGDARSSSSAAAVELGNGALILVVAGAEAQSNGTGSLYLVRINETRIGESRTDGVIAVDVPILGRLELLGVRSRTNSFRGDIVKVTPFNNESLQDIITTVRANEADNPTPPTPECSCVPPTNPDDPSPPTNDEPDNEVKVQSAGFSRLPHTGANTMRTMALGFLLLAAGTVMRVASRRQTAAVWETR